MTALKIAIQLLTRFRFETADAAEPRGPVVLTLIPLVGAALSLVCVALAQLFVWLAGPILGPVLAGIAIPTGIWILQGGRGLFGVVGLMDAAFAGVDDDVAPYLRISAFQIGVLLKLTAVGLLVAAGHSVWLVPVLVLRAAVVAELTVPALGSVADKPDDGLDRHGHWIVAGVIALLATGFIGHVIAGVFALIIAWLAAPAFDRWLACEDGRDTSGVRWAAAELSDLLLLTIGLVYFLAQID